MLPRPSRFGKPEKRRGDLLLRGDTEASQRRW
jgi:hypothetical protein